MEKSKIGGMARVSTAFLVSALAIANAQAITVIHSNDVQGDIEPCGCRTDPKGGMARKAALIDRTKDQLIQLDAGDLFFPSTTVPAFLADQSVLQAEYLLKSMDLLEHDVVVPGEKDFALGVVGFEKLIKKSKASFLAANLQKKNGRPFLKPGVILKRGLKKNEVRIGVFGLVGSALEWPKELKVSPSIAAAQKQVAAFKGKVDFIIAVTHQGLEEDQKLAQKVPGIDLIVGGHSQSFLQTPAQVGRTAIIQSSFKNQYVGALHLVRLASKGGLDVKDYQLVGLDAGYDSPVASPSKMDALVKDFKQALGDLNTREDALLDKTANQAVEAEGMVPKFQTFPQCAGCHLKQFDFWRKTGHQAALHTLVAKGQEKNKECLVCHTVGLGDPKGFQSVATLAEYFDSRFAAPSQPTSENDPTPVAAADDAGKAPRKVGLSGVEFSQFLDTIHGAKDLKTQVKVQKTQVSTQSIPAALRTFSRAWAPVQCENCHGPGKNHPFSGVYTKKVESTTCLGCHTAERAPQWYDSKGKPDAKVIEAKRSLITCPAGDLSEIEE